MSSHAPTRCGQSIVTIYERSYAARSHRRAALPLNGPFSSSSLLSLSLYVFAKQSRQKQSALSAFVNYAKLDDIAHSIVKAHEKAIWKVRSRSRFKVQPIQQNREESHADRALERDWDIPRAARKNLPRQSAIIERR